MILVNIHRLSQTILLQSGAVWESSLFFHVNATLSGCFQGNTFFEKKRKEFPDPRPNVRSHEPKPETTLSYLWPSGKDTGDSTPTISRAANDCINECPCVESPSCLAGIKTRTHSQLAGTTLMGDVWLGPGILVKGARCRKQPGAKNSCSVRSCAMLV